MTEKRGVGRPPIKRQWNLSRDDLNWLAGYLEGEGCFYIAHRNSGRNHYPVISVTTTDHDIAKRVCGLIQATKIRKVPLREGCKQAFQIRVDSVMLAPLLNALLPLMGKRRQQKIRQVLRETA